MDEVKVQQPEIGYPSKKIEEFIGIAEKAIQNGKSLFTKYKNLILNITILDVVNNTEKYKELLSDMEFDNDKLHEVYDRFYRVIEKYDTIDNSSGIKKLDDLVSDIDYIMGDIYYLTSALENVIEAGEDLKKQYFNK
jgi:uncharacterized protein (UPF0305 family)